MKTKILLTAPKGKGIPVRNIYKILKKRKVNVEFKTHDELFISTNIKKLDYDIICSRRSFYSPVALTYIGIAEQLGIKTINSYKAVTLCGNRGIRDFLLKRAKIRVPYSLITSDKNLIIKKRDLFPLVDKGLYESYNIRGTNKKLKWHVIRTPNELRKVKLKDCYFFQKYQENDGFDYKGYFIGDEVFGMKEKSELWYEGKKSYRESRKSIKLPETLVETILKIKKILGLEIGGIDFIKTQNGFVVIDVNDFPTFRKIKEAPEKIADYIINYVRK